MKCVALLSFALATGLVLDAGAQVDDDEVKGWIASSLIPRGTEVTDAEAVLRRDFSVDESQTAWKRLKACRDAGDSLNLNLAAAEHYAFMRFVASKNGDTFYRSLPRWYETVKRFAVRHELESYLKASDQPVSPPNEKVTAWGLQGVERGLKEYQRLTGKEPSGKSGALGTLLGSSYYIYYYNAAGLNPPSDRACELEPPRPLQGRYQSDDASGRWLLEFNGSKCRWSERNASGQLLTREVAVLKLPDGTFKITRPNDTDVLTFLGYAPAIRAEIRSRSPEPSFLIIRKSGPILDCQWSGLLVIKDDKGKFKEMKQPGQSPAKGYRCVRPDA
jgi:hypothetical protein